MPEQEHRSIQVGAQSFHFFDEGQARLGTVVLLHGFPDSPHSFASLSSALVQCGYRVVRPYLPGYAPNRWQGSFAVEAICQRLLQFIDKLEAGAVHLVGHDWGAVLSYALLHAQPERFAASSTISIPHPLHCVDPKQLSLAQAYRSAYMLLFQLPWLPEAWLSSTNSSLVQSLWRRWSPSFSLGADELETIQSCLRASGPAPFGYYRSLGKSLLARPRVFGDVRTPLLYLHGEDDGCMGADLSIGQEKYFQAGYRRVLMPGLGHFLQVEAPQEVAELLASWFQSHRDERDK